MRLFIFATAITGLFAQQPNTVTATVSISQSIPAGSAVFRIQFVDATLASTIDGALASLASTGVNSSHLTGVSVALNQGFVITTYDFRLPVAAAEFAATRDKLISLQRSLSTSQTQGLGWSSVQTPTEEQLSSAVQQALPVLVERAKLRAAALAQAMNATLGGIVTLSAPALVAEGAATDITLSATFAVTPAQ